MSTPRKTTHYTEEQRADALRKIKENGWDAARASKELNLPDRTVRRWMELEAIKQGKLIPKPPKPNALVELKKRVEKAMSRGVTRVLGLISQGDLVDCSTALSTLLKMWKELREMDALRDLPEEFDWSGLPEDLIDEIERKFSNAVATAGKPEKTQSQN